MRCTLPNQITDQHDAGRDADAHLKGGSMACWNSGRCLDQRESATHCAFSVILMGLWIAKVGKHAIAHVLGDKPTRLANHLRAAAMIGTHDVSHVLGVEPSRERGRTHKVAEHNRKLAAFRRSCKLR